MNLARIKALSMMVCALCKVQRVTYTKLAAAFEAMHHLGLPCGESNGSLPSARLVLTS